MAPHPDEVLVLGRAGSIAVMNAHTWHGGTANRTDRPRLAMHAFYCRRDKPQQQYQKRLLDPEVQAGLGPELRALLALDDPLNDELSATVTVRTQPDWKVATGMRSAGQPRTFREANYHDLVDMPFFVGRFDYDSMVVEGKTHRLGSYPEGMLQGTSRAQFWEEIGKFVSGKLTSFVKGGSTALSVNLPEVAAPPLHSGTRIALLHDNVPGVLAEVNQLLADEGDNVTAQYLSTRGEQGYVVSDVSEPLSESAMHRLRTADHTIWLRTHTA